ncbi:MAG: hypothetical protein VKP62_02500 [Candidatus Sericytochromatia bacterium]|nr:hypothetical protein [Candidatus Sericytochromatia bacterium]
MTMINSNSGTHVNGLTKRVAAGAAPDSSKDAARSGSASAAFSSDSLVRSTATSATNASVAAASTAALDRLAAAYHDDPAVFARNLAVQSLNDVVSLVG